MSSSKFYRIRLPDPNKRFTGREYLFSLPLDRQEVMERFKHPVEGFIIDTVPSWALVMLGLSSLSSVTNFEHIKDAFDIQSESYRTNIDNLFKPFPKVTLSTGRTYRRQAAQTALQSGLELDVSHMIVGFWEQGVLLASSLVHHYVLSIQQGQRYIIPSITLLLHQLQIHTKRTPLIECVKSTLIPLMSAYNPPFTLFYDDDGWQASRTELVQTYMQKRGRKSLTAQKIKALPRSSHQTQQVTKIEHSKVEKETPPTPTPKPEVKAEVKQPQNPPTEMVKDKQMPNQAQTPPTPSEKKPTAPAQKPTTRIGDVSELLRSL